MRHGGSATFGLVHGGQHGPWCFGPLIEELGRRGHSAIAPDLPIEDPDAGAAAYAASVVYELELSTPPIFLVGHSMGGLVIPLAAQRLPVAGMIFLCGAFPEPDRSHLQVKTEVEGEALGATALWASPGDRHLANPELAREIFYNDCGPELQEWAIARLRPQCRRPLQEITPLRSWPSVPVAVINTLEDRCIPPHAARRTAQRLFGCDPLFLPGGHCSFIARPELVAGVLADLACRLLEDSHGASPPWMAAPS